MFNRLNGNIILAILLFYFNSSAIEILQDTAFGSSSNLIPAAHDTLTIRNTSLTDTIRIDSIYLKQLAPTICPQIAGISLMWNYWSGQLRQDSVYVDRPISPNLAIKISPNSSFITLFMVGSCLGCVSMESEHYADQCVIMATFFPNKGARDSVILIGPRVGGGTRFGVGSQKVSNIPKADFKVFDCRGRLVSTIGRTGIYLLTNGKYCSLQFLTSKDHLQNQSGTQAKE